MQFSTAQRIGTLNSCVVQRSTVMIFLPLPFQYYNSSYSWPIKMAGTFRTVLSNSGSSWCLCLFMTSAILSLKYLYKTLREGGVKKCESEERKHEMFLSWFWTSGSLEPRDTCSVSHVESWTEMTSCWNLVSLWCGESPWFVATVGAWKAAELWGSSMACVTARGNGDSRAGLKVGPLSTGGFSRKSGRHWRALYL